MGGKQVFSRVLYCTVFQFILDKDLRPILSPQFFGLNFGMRSKCLDYSTVKYQTRSTWFLPAHMNQVLQESAGINRKKSWKQNRARPKCAILSPEKRKNQRGMTTVSQNQGCWARVRKPWLSFFSFSRNLCFSSLLTFFFVETKSQINASLPLVFHSPSILYIVSWCTGVSLHWCKYLTYLFYVFFKYFFFGPSARPGARSKMQMGGGRTYTYVVCWLFWFVVLLSLNRTRRSNNTPSKCLRRVKSIIGPTFRSTSCHRNVNQGCTDRRWKGWTTPRDLAQLPATTLGRNTKKTTNNGCMLSSWDEVLCELALAKLTQIHGRKVLALSATTPQMPM